MLNTSFCIEQYNFYFQLFMVNGNTVSGFYTVSITAQLGGSGFNGTNWKLEIYNYGNFAWLSVGDLGDGELSDWVGSSFWRRKRLHTI